MRRVLIAMVAGVGILGPVSAGLTYDEASCAACQATYSFCRTRVSGYYQNCMNNANSLWSSCVFDAYSWYAICTAHPEIYGSSCDFVLSQKLMNCNCGRDYVDIPYCNNVVLGIGMQNCNSDQTRCQQAYCY